ncbi:hypothetical protein D3C72_1774050 [compost metagenome]
MLLQAFDQATDLASGTLGARGQTAHFVGDHGKAPALLTGPGGLDGGIQREQVGLIGNGADNLQHPANFLTVGGQLQHQLAQSVDMPGQFANGRHGTAHDFAAVTRLAVGSIGRRRRRHGAARNLLRGGEHLVHGSGHLIDLGLLTDHIARTFGGNSGHVATVGIGLIGSQTHRANHVADLM